MNLKIPLWASIILLVVLFILSGIFSGLNLGLMSLSIFELEILEASSDETERKCAQKIKPIRSSGNILLCTLLMANVIVNTTLTLITDGLFEGSNEFIVIAVSAGGTVLFGEIIPQAICSKYGLWIGANTVWLTKFFMILMYPLVWPIGKLLDFILGREAGTVYDREKMRKLVEQQCFLFDDEVNIITGALEITKKKVKDVMTKVNDIYMIPSDTVLNYVSVSEIMASGFSRIPIFYDGNRHDIRDVLLVKDLSFVDPDENIPVTTVVKFYDRPLMKVDENLHLNKILKNFKEGRTHLALAQSTELQITGLITLEDVIEEILQMEIMDETDVYTDNVRKIRRSFKHFRDGGLFLDSRKKTFLTPQLKIATLQYMVTNITCFKCRYLSKTFISNLLDSNAMEYRYPKSGTSSTELLYSEGQESDKGILLIQGRISVVIGKENLKFEAGPFMFFGESIFTKINECIIKKENHDTIVKKAKFVPDFTAIPATDLQYIEISGSYYLQLRELFLKLGIHEEKPTVKRSMPVTLPKIQIISKKTTDKRRASYLKKFEKNANISNYDHIYKVNTVTTSETL